MISIGNYDNQLATIPINRPTPPPPQVASS